MAVQGGKVDNGNARETILGRRDCLVVQGAEERNGKKEGGIEDDEKDNENIGDIQRKVIESWDPVS